MHHIVLHEIPRVMDFHPVEANLRQSFRILAAGRAAADVIELPGISIASPGVTFQMFNAAFLNSPVASQDDFEDRIERARGHFRKRKLAWAFWLCDDWADWRVRRKATAIFQSHGLRLSSEMPGMVAMPPFSGRKESPPLEIRKVVSARTLEDFRAIGSVCFHVPLAWFSEVFNIARPAFTCYVGYRDGEPVATSASVISDGVLGLYNIATAPAHRKLGFGEAITRHTIGESKLPVVLQSTASGLRMYERLGFRPVTRISVYNSI